MADPLCAECSRPIQSTDDKETVEQVDACTMAVEHLTYHATCSPRPPRAVSFAKSPVQRCAQPEPGREEEAGQ